MRTFASTSLVRNALPVPWACGSACGWFISKGSFAGAVVWGLKPLHCQAPLALMEPDRSGKQDLHLTTCLTFRSCAGQEVAASPSGLRLGNVSRLKRWSCWQDSQTQWLASQGHHWGNGTSPDQQDSGPGGEEAGRGWWG